MSTTATAGLMQNIGNNNSACDSMYTKYKARSFYPMYQQNDTIMNRNQKEEYDNKFNVFKDQDQSDSTVSSKSEATTTVTKNDKLSYLLNSVFNGKQIIHKPTPIYKPITLNQK